jgi:hypothetical protein
MSQVVGSAVASTTRVRPTAVGAADQESALAVARVADHRVAVAKELLRLFGGDATRAQLVDLGPP